VNLKLLAAMDSTAELIFSGVFERFPALKTVIVENEIGWLPFALTQWDFYCKKEKMNFSTLPFKKLPSEYARTNVYATFFSDSLSEVVLQNWSSDNFMWSNDYPHANSTWPNSQEFVDHQLEHLSGEVLNKVLRGNAEKLYGLPATL
jgi:predicted TIM-barrel fold metal-dependent hydrolase